MRRIGALIISALVVLALAPATSSAAQNGLRGQPQMFRVDAESIEVRFTTDEKLADGVHVAIPYHSRRGAGAGARGGLADPRPLPRTGDDRRDPAVR